MTARERIRRATVAIQTAERSGAYVPAESLHLLFPGMRLLSANALMGLHNAMLTPYKQACHQAVHEAVLSAAGCQYPRPMFQRVHLTLYREGPRLLDEDSLGQPFKYLVDGLTKARVIPDDAPAFVAVETRQARGKPLVELRLQAVE